MAVTAAHGSTFVIAKQGDVIIVGTDSRVTLTIDHSRTKPGLDACKIYKIAKNRYFVIAAAPLINTKTGIDYSAIATRVFNGSGDPKGLANEFEARALDAAERILKEDAQTTVLSVVFFGHDRVPFFHSRSIRRTPVEIYRQPEDCDGNCSKWVAGGFHQVIDKLAPQSFGTRPIEDAIVFLITSEIEADRTGLIGPPIVLFRLDKTGEHWLSPGACRPPSPEQQK